MLHLKRSDSDNTASCRCSNSLLAVPDQSETPWDGSGWQCQCHSCGKAFTFGKAIRVDMKLRDFVLKDLKKRDIPPELMKDRDFIDGCCESIEEMLVDIEEGKEYVYFDGVLIPTDYEGRIEFDGLFAAHDLATLPHTDLKTDKNAARHVLGDPRYWNDRALPPIDEDEDDEGFDDEDDEDDEGDDDLDEAEEGEGDDTGPLAKG